MRNLILAVALPSPRSVAAAARSRAFPRRRLPAAVLAAVAGQAAVEELRGVLAEVVARAVAEVVVPAAAAHRMVATEDKH